MEDNVHFINAATDILALPAELLQQIFSNLTTEERLPLGLTCKRFREADLDLGCKNFEEISISVVRISTQRKFGPGWKGFRRDLHFWGESEICYLKMRQYSVSKWTSTRN